ncbi:MAG: hypothetical protein KAY22_26350 [Rhizorhabdus sp.]|jgi:hypothetical protein|uniref:hypothetical protein n=1 Tax=Rhizorhabdus sp. TaxID=1968843 RepID=UPI001B659BEE|nr:hypothetical protein [Rhizorhabdus sp.]MBP8235820.1 hypothetical protein [Rhizorhabdus sp.]
MKRIDLRGQRFGRLVVLDAEPVGAYEKGHGSGIKRGGNGHYVRKYGYPEPNEQPEPVVPIEERERTPRLPTLGFLERRFPWERQK